MRSRFSALIFLMIVLMLAADALALQVRQTFPAAFSETFRTRDTLRIRFDRTPSMAFDRDIVITGLHASYPIAWQAIRGDTLLMVSSHYWLTGDKITVTVTSPYVTTRYVFSFTVEVPLGNPGGPWQGQTLSAIGSVPRALCAVDLDGDGPVELIGLSTGMLGYARNTLYDDSCGGACVPFTGEVLPILPGPGYSDGPRVLRAGDLNGDGKPELVASDFGRNTLVIYRNISNPGDILFDVDTIQVVLGITAPRDFQIVDLNADGWMDLVVIGLDPNPVVDRLAIYLNDGTGTIQFVIHDFPVGSGPTMLDVSDFNGDHARDLVVSCLDQRSVNRFLNIAGPTFDLARDSLIRALPSAPDGVIAENLFWDNLEEERPDLLVWSKGLHTDAVRQRTTLDETPFLYRYRNAGNGFDTPLAIPIVYAPLDVTPAQLNPSHTGRVGNEWIILGDSAGARRVYAYTEGMSLFNLQLQGTALVRPLSSIAFDADLDGDIDLFFADETSPGTGRVTYYMNPDSVSQPTIANLDFGTIPAQCVSEGTYYYRNTGAYPAVICRISMTNDAGGTYGLLSPLNYPLTVGPGDSLPVRFRFAPCSDFSPSGEARIAFYGAVGGCHRLDLFLTGTGGLARYDVQIDSSGYALARDTLDFGFVDPNAIRTDSIRLMNHGNWSLNAWFDPSHLQRFTWQGPDSEFVSTGGATGEWHRVQFRAPPNLIDSVILERFRVYDSTLCRNSHCAADSSRRKWIVMRAHVLRNDLPEFICPPDTLCEGDTGTFVIPVRDPNPYPNQPVMCSFDGVSSDLITTTPDVLYLARRNALTVHYRVRDDVAYPSETCSLRVVAIDNQYTDRSVVHYCVLTVCGLNDPPWVIPIDTTIYEGDSLANWVCATAHDEELDVLSGDAAWLPPLPGDNPRVNFSSVQNRFRLNWRPGYNQGSRVYPIQYRVWSRTDTSARDSAIGRITVLNRPSNLRAELWATPDTVRRNQTVDLHWRVTETLNVPMDTSFVVRVIHVPPGEDTVTVFTRRFDSLAAGGMWEISLVSSQLSVCGDNQFSFIISPASPDANPADDIATVPVRVRCPDIDISSLTAPPIAFSGESFTVAFTIRETSGLPFEVPFPVSLVEETRGDTLWSRPQLLLAAHQVISDSVPYTSRVCGNLVFRMRAMPWSGSDADPTNDSRTVSVRVYCPELAVESFVVPSIVHKNTDFMIRFSIVETNGVAADASFVASVRSGGCESAGTIIRNFSYRGIPAYGRIEDSLHWTVSTAGNHPISIRIAPQSGQDSDPNNNCLDAEIGVESEPFFVHPQPFTPNNDTYNDLLYFDFGDETYLAASVKIFTLDGRLVVSLSEQIGNVIRWDGEDRSGSACAPGSYLYVLEDGGRKVSSGIIYLAR
jgi:hypothetical protein